MNVNEAVQSTKPDPPELEFKRLSTECRLGAFSCGERDIDNWFRNKALNEHQKLRSRVVTAHLRNNNNPCGFYALSINIEPENNFIGTEGPSLFFWAARNGYLATVHLRWIAVLTQMQRQGIGTIIMGDALHEFYETAIRTGIAALTLTSIDIKTTEFYKKLGFQEYGQTSSTPKMFLAADAVISLNENNAC